MMSELPADLPSDWDRRPLGEVARITRKPPSLNISDARTIPFVPMALIPEGAERLLGWESRTPAEIRSGVYFETGNVLVPKITPCLENGKQALVDDIPGGWGFATTEIFPLVGTVVTSGFLDLYLRASMVRAELAGKMQGTTGRQRLPREALLSLPVPVPPPQEQQAIARVLRTVQRAKEATEQVITAARELKRSMMRHLFSYGVGGATATKEVEFGLVPSSWEMMPLGELSTVIRGASPRPKGNPRYFATDVTDFPWIMISDLRTFQRGKVLTHTREYLTAEGSQKSRFVEAGTLLLTNSGTVGKPAILGFDGCIHDGYLGFLDLDRRLRKHYLYYLFQYLEGHLLTLAPRGTQANLNTRILKTLQIPVPSVATQDLIDSALTAVDRKIEAEEGRRDALATLFDSVLHDLMTGRRRVSDLEVPA